MKTCTLNRKIRPSHWKWALKLFTVSKRVYVVLKPQCEVYLSIKHRAEYKNLYSALGLYGINCPMVMVKIMFSWISLWNPVNFKFTAKMAASLRERVTELIAKKDGIEAEIKELQDVLQTVRKYRFFKTTCSWHDLTVVTLL